MSNSSYTLPEGVNDRMDNVEQLLQKDKIPHMSKSAGLDCIGSVAEEQS